MVFPLLFPIVNRFVPYALVVAIALTVVAMQWLARRRDRETGEGN